jgi:unsaturated rhamnogalacturonyl hydrolase
MQEKIRHRKSSLIAALFILAAQLSLPSLTRAQNMAAGASLWRQGSSAPGSGTDGSRAIVESNYEALSQSRRPLAPGVMRKPYSWSANIWSQREQGIPRYLQYIRDWIDLHVDAQGNLDHKTESLDSMMPGNLLVLLYQETKEEKYKLASK